MDLQRFADMPQDGEEGGDEANDRDEVRQMSSFLRDFQGAVSEEESADSADNPLDETEAAPIEEQTHSANPDDSPRLFKLPDGREVTAEQILELEKGYMMQSDYTRKTQALADARRQLEEERAANEKAFKLQQDYEDDPMGTALRLQEQAEAKGIFEAKSPEALALEVKQRELAKRESEIQRKEEEARQEAVYREMESRILALEAKYGKDFDRDYLIRFMTEQQVYSPEVAWNAIRASIIEAKRETEVEALKQQLKNAKEVAISEYVKTKTTKQPSSLPVGAGATGSPPVQVNRPKTLDDAMKAAMARPYNP